MSRVLISKVKNYYTIRKNKGGDFFYLRNDAIIISTFNFSALLKFMLFRGLINPKVLEGVLDEYYNSTS